MTTAIARRLRRNMTDAEARLWSHLRANQLGVKFRRQMPIQNFITDFACQEARLIIEVDGGQHALAESKDHQRDAMLASAGYLVLRFWNSDVLANIDGVLDEIARALAARGATNR